MKLPPLPKGRVVRDLTICKDGFTLSIQASNSHYCKPYNAVTDEDYTHFEVGYPSDEEPLLLPYKETADNDYRCVYPFVPKEVIEQIVEKHGGTVEQPV